MTLIGSHLIICSSEDFGPNCGTSHVDSSNVQVYTLLSMWNSVRSKCTLCKYSFETLIQIVEWCQLVFFKKGKEILP